MGPILGEKAIAGEIIFIKCIETTIDRGKNQIKRILNYSVDFSNNIHIENGVKIE